MKIIFVLAVRGETNHGNNVISFMDLHRKLLRKQRSQVNSKEVHHKAAISTRKLNWWQ